MIELIKRAIEVNNRNLEWVKENKANLCNEALMSEFLTIHINAGRRTGKSSAIGTLARKGDLIVVHDERTKETFRRHGPACLAKVVSIREALEPMMDFMCQGPNAYAPISKPFHEYVWIDEPGMCDNLYDINMLYKVLIARLFIKVGS